MASAAAVAANSAMSPMPVNETNDLQTTVGSAAYEADAPFKRVRSENGNDEDDDDDDDVVQTGRRKPNPSKTKHSAEADEDVEMADQADDMGLFGEDSDEDNQTKKRHLNDADLNSDDGQLGRIEDEEMQDDTQQVEERFTAAALQIPRQPQPEPSDGELYLLKIPPFLAFEPAPFHPASFQPPITDLHSNDPPSESFSARQAAARTIRWRQSLRDPTEKQSNARLLRWSDGSLTLQLASDPKVQYAMPATSYAPQQRNPLKPTPTSLKENSNKKSKRAGKYDPNQDSFMYLTAPVPEAEIMRVTNKITAGLQVEQSTEAADDALLQLKSRLTKGPRGPSSVNDGESKSTIGVVQVTEDPELAKKRAELAEKESNKAQKKRDAQKTREEERAGRVLGRRGLGGLSIGALEDADELGAGIPRAKGPRKPKPRRPNTRGDIYSSDEEEDYGRGRVRNKEDEYDEEDDFVAKSDEEEEEVEEDEDEGDEEPDTSSKPAPRSKATTPLGKDDEDQTVGDAGAASPVARGKRRRVIDEDEEDE